MKPLIFIFVFFVLQVGPQSRAMENRPSLAGQKSTGASMGTGWSAAAQQTPSPSASVSPIPPKPPGERDPVVGVLAILAILVAGGAGVFIYRVIRKGL